MADREIKSLPVSDPASLASAIYIAQQSQSNPSLSLSLPHSDLVLGSDS